MNPRLPQVFAALADPTRLSVFERLASGMPMTATELARDLPVSRQAVSKHLAILGDAGLVDRAQLGREVRFRARGDHLDGVVEWAAQVGGEWDGRLERLHRSLE